MRTNWANQETGFPPVTQQIHMSRDMRFPTCGLCDQRSLRSACAYAQSDQSLCQSLEHSMTVELLTEHHLEFVSLKGGCTSLSEPTHVKMPHCWKSHATAHMSFDPPLLTGTKNHSTKQHDPTQNTITQWEQQQTMNKQQHNHTANSYYNHAISRLA